MRYVIDDEAHSEWVGEFETRDEAIAELQRLVVVPWYEEPNQAPCANWRNCGRHYELVEFDSSTRPWKEQRRWPALRVKASEVVWLLDASTT